MEKEVIMKILSLYSLLFLSLLVAPAFAKPTAVTLYPRGATIFEQTTIPAGAEAVSLQLPNVAIQKSLKLKLIEASGQRIGGIEFESILPDTSAFQELQNRIDQLEKEIANVTDQLESNKRTLDYWKNQQDLPIKTLADVRAMGKIIHDESITLLQNSTQLDRQKKDLEQQRDEARNTLQQKTGKNQRRWKVTIRLTAPASDNIDMVYSYRVRQAGWSADYTLNALPTQKRVEWTWTARISQQTGIDWNGVKLKIATAEPVFTLTPPNLGSWDIRDDIRDDYVADTGDMERMVMAISAPKMVNAPPPRKKARRVPVRNTGQLFDTYDLGRVAIASGKESRIKVREGQWKAAFTYLSRPLVSNQVFLEAKLALAEDFLPLPTGRASIQVDGVHVGQKNFSLYKKQNVSISFGSDPGLLVKVKTDHIAGEKGVLSKKGTYNWNWLITFTNNKEIPVKLRVEDRIPHVWQEDITLKENFSEPLPEKKDNTLVWNLTLAPQGKQQIKYGYSVAYPKDMPVLLGR
jgi:uncharacterized protein (TIGR02231 family)